REELLLERLRRRRDDDAQARFERRQEVGETLARPGPGLGDEVLPGQERALDGSGERRLLGAGLEAGQGGGECAAGAKGVVHSATRLRERTDVPSAISRPLTKMFALCGFLPPPLLTAPRAVYSFRPSDPVSLRA